jgi:NAD(P)-dependent dehydrogenase (short-subunit alcohol dehydrogenase family)
VKALVTKARPGSIAEAVGVALMDYGYEVTHLPVDYDLRQIDEKPPHIDWDTEVLVNCVGVTDMHPINDWSFEDANRVITANLTCAIALTSRFVANTIGSTKFKTIVHIGSLWSRKSASGGAAYCASKAGLAHYVACAGSELPEGYSIVGIHPGNVYGTPMSRRVALNLAVKRGMHPAEIDKLYECAIRPSEVGNYVLDVICKPWLNGENIYLGGGDKR